MIKKFLLFLLSINSIVCYNNSNIINNIVIIADIHGDIKNFNNILMNSNIINNNKWTSPSNTIIIQLGDQIDPKSDDIINKDKRHHFEMIYYTKKLQSIASKNNCDFISLIGNHELLNINKIKKNIELKNIIAERPIILKINNYLFSHGIFKKIHFDLLQLYNKELNDINIIWYKYVNDFYINPIENIILYKLILDINDGILNSKILDNKSDTKYLLNILDLQYMFIGHIKVSNIILINQIWFLNLYLKNAFDDKVYNNILIKNNNIFIIPMKNIYYDDCDDVINIL